MKGVSKIMKGVVITKMFNDSSFQLHASLDTTIRYRAICGVSNASNTITSILYTRFMAKLLKA